MASKHASLLLTVSDVCEIVTRVGLDGMVDEVTGGIEEAIRSGIAGSAIVPPRSGVYYRSPEWGLLEWMPAYIGQEATTTVKLVGYHPANPERRNLPTVISSICVFDGESGHLRGLVDGTFPTALRTGAASAVASRILASPESRTIGVVGCGAQAVTQVHALSRVFDLERVLAYDIDDEAALSLGDRVAFTGVPVEAVRRESLATLLEDSDILCTCTSAGIGEGPVIPDFTNKPHLHVNAVGSDFAGKFELPVSLLRRGLVVPDFTDQAMVEGECQQLQQVEVGPDLSEIVGNPSRAEGAHNCVTVFDSTGWAVEDHVVGGILLGYAQDLGLGHPVELECIPPDPRNPYSFLDEELRQPRTGRDKPMANER